MTNLRGGPTWPPMRHPFEVAAIVAFWLIGLFGMAGAGSGTLALVLPVPFLLAWHGSLVVAATMGAMSAALAVRQPLTALLCERLFLFGVGPLALVYAAALLSVSGRRAAVPVVYFTVYAVAAFVRLWQAQVYLRWRRSAVTGEGE